MKNIILVLIFIPLVSLANSAGNATGRSWNLTPNAPTETYNLLDRVGLEERRREEIARQSDLGTLIDPPTDPFNEVSEEDNGRDENPIDLSDDESVEIHREVIELALNPIGAVNTVNQLASQVGTAPGSNERECSEVVENNDDPFDVYIDDPRVQLMIETMRDNSRDCLFHSQSERKPYRMRKCNSNNEKAAGASLGLCLRYVKYGIIGGGFIEDYPDGEAAKNFGEKLEYDLGFVNVFGEIPAQITNARQAPAGSILVYDGGEYGHIEVKTGEDTYISDFETDIPISENPRLERRLIGVYVHHSAI